MVAGFVRVASSAGGGAVQRTACSSSLTVPLLDVGPEVPESRLALAHPLTELQELLPDAE